MRRLDPGEHGEHVDTLLEDLHRLSELGVAETHGSVPHVSDLKRLEILGDRVIPVAAAF